MLEHPVWGIDPSTRRIALAIVLPAGGFVHRTLELGPGSVDPRKLALARSAMVPWFESVAAEFDPGWLWVEQPYAHGNSVHPASFYMVGVLQEAALVATGAVANLVSPTEWKKAAGLHGFARKRPILDWARGLGFPEDCDRCESDGRCKGSAAHDRADALGVAVAGVSLVGGTSAVSGTVNTCGEERS